jgi:hypothetical protein
VSVKFAAECPVQIGFEHGPLDWRGSGSAVRGDEQQIGGHDLTCAELMWVD